jgi:hypothetical protein
MSDDEKELQKRDAKTSLPSTNILDTALDSLSEEELAELKGEALNEALRLQTKQAEIEIDSKAARGEVQEHIDAFGALNSSGKLDRHKITSEHKTGVGTRKIESKRGATCFVVTAVYGDPDHEVVLFYRTIRDTYLIRRSWGRKFIAWYYKNGPRYASYIRDKKGLSKCIRFCLKTIRAALLAVIKKRNL